MQATKLLFNTFKKFQEIASVQIQELQIFFVSENAIHLEQLTDAPLTFAIVKVSFGNQWAAFTFLI